MKKKSVRIAAFAMALVMLFSSAVFANSEIIAPSNNQIIYGDSFYVSARLTGSGRLRVSIFEMQLETMENVRKELKLQQGGVVTIVPYYVLEAVRRKYTDVSGLSESDLSILSVGKDLEGKKKKTLSNGKAAADFHEATYMDPVIYSTKTNAGLYLKEYQNVQPGIYKILVEELGDNDAVLSKNVSMIVMKAGEDPKPESEEVETAAPSEVFDNAENSELLPTVEEQILSEESKPQVGTTVITKIINFLKSLFK